MIEPAVYKYKTQIRIATYQIAVYNYYLMVVLNYTLHKKAGTKTDTNSLPESQKPSHISYKYF